VAGYHTEYSAMKFAFFMLAEYSMMIVNSCLIVTLFFGGWSLSMFGLGLTTEKLQEMGLAGGLLGAAIFIAKVMFFVLAYVWTRATFPRFRFDQLMDLGWKFMIPLALANIFVTGLFILAGQERTMNLIGVGVIGLAALYLFKPRRREARKVAHAS
jgi:NADH-quinone oxidoreductase subunit H